MKCCFVLLIWFENKKSEINQINTLKLNYLPEQNQNQPN